MSAIKRSGFAMIMAIFIIVLIALGGVMILNNTSVSAKAASDKYIRAQAELIADSATEFAVMRVQGFNTAGGNCLNQITINVNDSSGAAAYVANVTLQYSFRNNRPAGGGTCNVVQENTGKDTSVLVDVAVTANPDANLSTEPVRVHRRSWQKF